MSETIINRQRLGENIRKRRLQLLYSQKELGSMVGVSQAQIANIESGRNIPSLPVMYLLTGVLGYGFVDLLESE